MENDTKRDEVNNLEEIKKHPEWLMARILFQRFGSIHDFHLRQLGRYSISCCNISYGGAFSINPETKTVSFHIQTERAYFLKDNQKIRRSKYSILGYLKVPKKRYRAEYKLAKVNLARWASILLWKDTTIEVYFDKEMPSARQ